MAIHETCLVNVGIFKFSTLERTVFENCIYQVAIRKVRTFQITVNKLCVCEVRLGKVNGEATIVKCRVCKYLVSQFFTLVKVKVNKVSMSGLIPFYDVLYVSYCRHKVAANV
jgi:hypothetical protein